uniref:Ig-like domain-containing protein n=1 Tax=Petromyzon marinus TaxID=7757 RepID=S4R681_PETMA
HGGVVSPLCHCHAVFGVLGSEVTLKCGFPEDTMGGQFVWTLNGSGLTPNSDVTLRQNRLTLNNASAQYAGSYSCSPAGTNDVVDYILLNLGSMPKTATIQCRAVNYNHFKCVWSNENNINFKAQYRFRFVGNDTVVECTLLGGGNVCIGAWPGSPSPTLELHVSASNSFGVTNSSVQLQLKTVRKAQPTLLCMALMVSKPASLCVRWAAPASWRLPEVFPLQYRLRFNVSHVVHLAICGYFYMCYIEFRCSINILTQVAARDAANNGEWSEWSQPITLPCS